MVKKKQDVDYYRRLENIDCPFCGAYEVSIRSRKENNITTYSIVCATCGALGPERNSENEAATAWINRPGVEPIEEIE